MKNVLLVLIFAVIFVGCHPTKPPAPPICGDNVCDASKGETATTCPSDCAPLPPKPVCGDGKCDPGETPENCSADCKAPGPVCGNGKCEKGETKENCPADCTPTPEPEILKPVKDFSKIVEMGPYVGVTGQSNFDWKALFERMYPTKYNYVSVHMISPWNNWDGFYPWPIANNKFDVTKRNADFYAHLDDMVHQAVINGGFGIEICLFDSYGDPKWRKYAGYGMKLHPFVENNVGVDLVGGGSLPLYQNWKKTGFQDKDFFWLAWKADAHDNVLEAHGANKLGDAMVDYVQQVAALFGKYNKQYPTRVNLMVRIYNEPDTSLNADGSYSGLGEDARVENWVYEQFKAQGFKLGKQFKMIHGGNVRAVDNSDCYSCMTKNVSFSRAQGWKYEVHGCDSEMLAGMTKAGADKNTMICSLDGVHDAEVSVEAKKVLATQWPIVDIKVADVWSEPKWTRDMNLNLKTAYPEMLDVVKGLKIFMPLGVEVPRLPHDSWLYEEQEN